MTPKELSKKKAKFISDSEEKSKRKFTLLEKKLFEIIFDKIISVLDTTDGIIDSTSKNLKASAALDRIFKDFKSKYYIDLVTAIGSDLNKIIGYNKSYFKKIINTDIDQDKFETITNQVDRFMRERVGIANDGSIKKKSFLDRLITDNTVRDKFKERILQAVTNRKPIGEFIKESEVFFKGNKKVNGKLTQYFNTYLGDTYSQFDRATGKLFAEKTKIKCFVYQGGLIESSRKFCKKRDGKIFTTEEAMEWEKLIGKEDGPMWTDAMGSYNPLIDCGGANCRHSIDYISDSLAIKLRPDLKGKI